MVGQYETPSTFFTLNTWMLKDDLHILVHHESIMAVWPLCNRFFLILVSCHWAICRTNSICESVLIVLLAEDFDSDRTLYSLEYLRISIS